MNQYAGRLAGLGVATIVFSVLVFISGVALAIMLGSGTILLSSDANSMSESANAVSILFIVSLLSTDADVFRACGDQSFSPA